MKAWLRESVSRQRTATMYVVEVIDQKDAVVVKANVDGDFDRRGLPDPLLIAFYFTVHDDKIIQLIILRNEPV